MPDDYSPEAQREFGQPAAVAQLPQLAGGTPLYLSGEDALKLTAWNSAAGVTVRMTGRFLPVNSGRVARFAYDLVPATDRSASTRVCPLGEGWLLDVSVIASAGTPTVGQCFVAVTVTQGQVTGALDLSLLLTGYVTAASRAGWPNNQLLKPVEGAYGLRSITGTDPAANVEISETVPARTRWQLLAVEFTLVTDANVAARRVQLVFDDGANEYFRTTAQTDQAATVTTIYAAGSSLISMFGNPTVMQGLALPNPMWLAAGHRFRTVTINRQVGDNYGAPQYLVGELIEV